MKVLDLQCAQGHAFEGWFASEQDFVSQCERSLVQCPLCGDATVHKLLSAPRLNLSLSRHDQRADIEVLSEPAQPIAPSVADGTLTSAWLELSRRIIASTQDVGERFAEEARKMHYGEAEERSIRGKTTLDEARALVEEGIDVLPMVLPQSLKKPLQ
jgi:hypothetical protein